MPDLLLDRVTAALGDQYLIEGELGRGGMSVVYRALELRLNRRVAIKVLPPELAFDPAIRDRFQREAETAARLNHPHIVPIFSVGDRDGVAYLVMALIDGEPLGARMAREGPPSEATARRVLAEVADALAYAHAHGVVHRDIKPDNILLDRESGRAVVTDFGIARAAQESTRLTVTGVAVGTPTYMSPEQAVGERELDGRSDQYSLGVVGYQMLAGRPPFAAANSMALLMKHVSETPRPLGELRPDLPAALCAAIDRALAKRPEDRWPTAAAFRDAVLGAGSARVEGAARVTGGAVGAPAGAPAGAAANGAGRWGAPPNNNGRAAAPAERNPSPAGATAPPPFLPAPPQTLPREWWTMSRRERRAMLREYRRQWRDGWRGSPRELQLAGDSGDPPLDLDVLAFRRQLARSTTAIGICWAINLATTRYPWAIFPTIGIGAGLAGRLSSLWARGVSWERIFGPGRLGVQPPGSKLEQLVRRFRRRVRWILSGLGIAAVSFVFGVSHVLDGIGIGAGVGILGFLAGGATAVANTVGALLMVGPLRRRGVGVLGALSDDWRELAAADASPGATSDRRAAGTEREALPAAAPHPAVRLVPPEVLAGPYGDAVRRAADDRETIRGIIARLAPADRELLPEVEPTVDALVERVASLAPTLHRLDADLSPELLASTASRIDTVRSEPENAERDRRLALLERQQTTLRDLTERRRVLAGQLESAGLALRNLRLDLLRLRSSGVQATLGDLNNATQEARALSRDIAHVLGAADELRKL